MEISCTGGMRWDKLLTGEDKWENPFQNPPPYEGLVGNLNGYYSRRINIQHRLVYQVYNEPVVIDGKEYEGTIKIVRMWSHYDAVR